MLKQIDISYGLTSCIYLHLGFKGLDDSVRHKYLRNHTEVYESVFSLPRQNFTVYLVYKHLITTDVFLITMRRMTKIDSPF